MNRETFLIFTSYGMGASESTLSSYKLDSLFALTNNPKYTTVVKIYPTLEDYEINTPVAISNRNHCSLSSYKYNEYQQVVEIVLGSDTYLIVDQQVLTISFVKK